MDELQYFERFVIERMKHNIWYKVQKHEIEYYKKLFEPLLDENIELTFNEDYTKIKKTIWKKGKPI